MNNIIIEAISMAPMPGGRYQVVLSDEQAEQLQEMLHILEGPSKEPNIRAHYHLAMVGYIGTDAECNALWVADHGPD